MGVGSVSTNRIVRRVIKRVDKQTGQERKIPVEVIAKNQQGRGRQRLFCGDKVISRHRPLIHPASFTALGGGSEIGGSCYWYKLPWPGSKYGYLSIIVDYGMRPRRPDDIPDIRGIDHVDVILLSHEHADHCIYVPMLASMFKEAVVYTTQEAFEMSLLQWKETLHINKKRSHSQQRQFFTEIDVLRMVREQIRIISFYHTIELPASVFVDPINAGHMLGAASFHIRQNLGFGRRISVYHTGDISFENQYLIPGAPRLYQPREEIRTVVGDATNLDGSNVNREEEVKRFIAAVREVLARNGRVVIPVFKYHKAQEIWQILLSNGIPLSMIFVDGNAAEVFGIYEKYTAMYPLPESQIIGRSNFGRWERWTRGGPRVILAFGGMVHRGSPAWENMRVVIENENDAIFSVGYAEPCSPGGEILEHFAKGKKEIEIGLEHFEIKCRVLRFQLGSHAGGNDLLQLAARARDRVIWVHGEDKRVRRFLKKEAPRNHLQGRNGKEIRL